MRTLRSVRAPVSQMRELRHGKVLSLGRAGAVWRAYPDSLSTERGQVCVSRVPQVAQEAAPALLWAGLPWDVTPPFQRADSELICSSLSEHANYFGVDEKLGPVAVSIKREKLEDHKDHGPQYQYRIIFRTREVRPITVVITI